MKNTMIALVLCVLMIATGCSTAWLAPFENYVKIAGPILIQILEIVSVAKGVPVNPALAAKITADQAAVTALANSINSATSANLPTTCSAFNQAVATFAGDLTQIERWPTSDPTPRARLARL